MNQRKRRRTSQRRMKGTTKNRRKKKKNESEQLRITEAGQLLAALGPLCDVVGPFKRSHRRRFDAKTAAIATKKISSVTPYVISFSFDALLESNQFPFYRIFKRFNNGRGIKIISNTHHKKKENKGTCSGDHMDAGLNMKLRCLQRKLGYKDLND